MYIQKLTQLVHTNAKNVLYLHSSSSQPVNKQITLFNHHFIRHNIYVHGTTKARLAIFTARRLAKRGICRRRVSVCLSHSGIVSKRLNVGSRKQRRTIAP